MPQDKSTNRSIVLASRPLGAPTIADFRLESSPVPSPSDGQVLLRTVYLSLDPYMRARMSDAPSYAPAVGLGDVMVAGVVSRVETSLHPDYSAGDWVLAYSGWQDYSLSDGQDLTRLGSSVPHPSQALGVLGMPGFAAYMGLIDIGNPKMGETIVVAAATGAVGSLVGQIGKIKGCNVIGIAGSADKCHYAITELGLDACIDHRSPNLASLLADACPNGIDIYFENVGGVVFDAAVPLLNSGSRIPLCGLVSQYNELGFPPGSDHLPQLMATLLKRRVRMQGFLVYRDYGHRFVEFYEQVSSWLADGHIKYREDIVDGLENAPQAFIGMLEGKNFGKQVIRVAQD